MGNLSWKQLKYDPESNCTFLDLPQLKTTKVKRVVFVAGANTESCWLVDMADHLSMEPRPVYEEGGQGSFVFEELASASSSGTKLGKYLKAVCSEVTELPENPNAAGIRSGAANLLHSLIAVSFACMSTGHTHPGSAFFEYIDAGTAMVMVGAMVLAGWAPPAWGHCSAGPKPPKLHALTEDQPALTTEKLLEVIDIMFNIDEAHTPPPLRPGGELRALLVDAFAALVMHYKKRLKVASNVCKRMRDVLVQCGLAAHDVEAHAQLTHWSSVLAEQFLQDNLHLTDLTGDTVVMQLTEAIRQMRVLQTTHSAAASASQQAVRGAVSAMDAKVNELTKEVRGLSAQNMVLSQQNVALGDKLNALLAFVQQLVPGVPASVSHTAASQQLVATQPSPSPTAATPPLASEAAEALVVLAADRQTTPMAAATPMLALVAQPRMDVGTALRAPEPLTPMTLSGMAAKELLAEAYYDGGNGKSLPSFVGKSKVQDTAAAVKCLGMLIAVTTEPETEQLKAGKKLQHGNESVAAQVVVRLAKRMVEVYEEAELDVPAQLTKAMKSNIPTIGVTALASTYVAKKLLYRDGAALTDEQTKQSDAAAQHLTIKGLRKWATGEADGSNKRKREAAETASGSQAADAEAPKGGILSFFNKR